ncbi:MAG: hypothetical protein ACI39U_00115 [Candidatus Cryptobacteroides sp.]
MKTFAKTLVIVGAIALAACNKEVTPEPVHGNNTTDMVEYDLESELLPSVYYLSDDAAFQEVLMSRSAKTAASAEEADMLVVTSSMLESYKDEIKKAWEEGRMIVELYPDNITHCKFWKSIDCPVYLIEDEDDNDLLFLAIRNYDCYQLQNPFLLDGFLSDVNVAEDENATETTDKKELAEGNYDIMCVEIEKGAEYLNTKLASFVDWANKNMEGPTLNASSGSSAFDGDLSKRIEDSKFSQHITKTLSIGADNYQICQVICSTPDKVTRHSTIDVNITITPLYVYQDCNDASVAGDYYFITMYVLSHNAPLYGIYKNWHGLVRTYAHVFYSERIRFSSQLYTRGLSPAPVENVRFFETPKPTSTQSSTSYSVGFSAQLNVNAQGGYQNGKIGASLTVGSSFTWSNSTSRTVADQSIEMSTTNGAVDYSFITNNLQWEDETQKAVPAIARTDQKCEASWCWRVPDTKDDDKQEAFAFRLNLTPYYGCRWRHATWGCEGAEKIECLLHEGPINFPINVPNRQRNGVISFKNTASLYVTEFRIIDVNEKVVASSGSAFEKNTEQNYQVPVGTYRIEYDIVDGDTGELQYHCRFRNVAVTTAKTTELNHTNAEKYK